MRRAIFLISAACFVTAQSVQAQNWTTTKQVPVWDRSGVIGDGVDRHAEDSTSEQGGDPPALDYEPAAVDEDGQYTRSAWMSAPTLPGDRQDAGEAKFRLTCEFGFFGSADPIIAYGEPSPHHHTFIGNMGVFENGGIEAVRTADYTDLREFPKSSCSGGPLNATLYWEPTLFYEIETGVNVPVKPNHVSFYYTLHPEKVEETYRLLRGLAFIGGVDPADRLAIARMAELDPDDWDVTDRRYNGWNGWSCIVGGVTAVPTVDADNDDGRQLVNDDGSDPWGGACEDPSYELWANNLAPSCWDGHNLTSPDGRDHFRYPVFPDDSGSPLAVKCPDGWWVVPHFEVKTAFPNGNTATGESGHAWRSKLHLSSDRMDPDPENWHPRGSTFHFDWMNGWDSVVQAEWMRFCTGTDQDGVAGDWKTCNDSTISDTNKLKRGTSPDTDLSRSPIVTFHSYYDDPLEDAFGPVEEGATVDVSIDHDHTD